MVTAPLTLHSPNIDLQELKTKLDEVAKRLAKANKLLDELSKRREKKQKDQNESH